MAQTTQTNQQIITEALQAIGVVATGRNPTPAQSNLGLTILNDNMLTQLQDRWHDIGWYPQSAVNLNVAAPLRDTDVADVKLVLAAWIAPRLGRTIPDSMDPDDMTKLANQIKAAFRRLNKRYLRQVEADLGELSRPQGGPWGGPNYFG